MKRCRVPHIVLYWTVLIGSLSMQSNVYAQEEVGFGCLGFVGGFAGYEFHQVEAPGLNRYVANLNQRLMDTTGQSFAPFDMIKGFRFGINFLRQDIAGVRFTLKGFYHTLSQKTEYEYEGQDEVFKNSLQLDRNNFGLGIDLGMSLFPLVSWKIVDAALVFTNISLKKTLNGSNYSINEKYKAVENKIGYSIGSGIIIHIIGDYVTLEGMAAYSKYSVAELKNAAGGYFTDGEGSGEVVTDFITAGGFNAAVQMNIGFPF